MKKNEKKWNKPYGIVPFFYNTLIFTPLHSSPKNKTNDPKQTYLTNTPQWGDMGNKNEQTYIELGRN